MKSLKTSYGSAVMILVTMLALFFLWSAFKWWDTLPTKEVVNGKCVRVLAVERGQEVTKPCSWLRPGQRHHVEHVGK